MSGRLRDKPVEGAKERVAIRQHCARSSRFHGPIALACSAMVFVNVGYLAWMPSYLYERFHLTLAQAGLYSMLIHHVFAFFGVILGGALSDRFAPGRPQVRLKTGKDSAAGRLALPLSSRPGFHGGGCVWGVGRLRIFSRTLRFQHVSGVLRGDRAPFSFGGLRPSHRVRIPGGVGHPSASKAKETIGLSQARRRYRWCMLSERCWHFGAHGGILRDFQWAPRTAEI